jgi:hypothetical protein
MRGAAGIGLGITIEYLRRTASVAAGNGPGTTLTEHSPAIHNERCRGQRPGHHDLVTSMHKERTSGAACNGLAQRQLNTALRCTTSGAAGDGLSITFKYLRAAAGIGLGTTIKHLLGTAGIVLGATIPGMYLY